MRRIVKTIVLLALIYFIIGLIMAQSKLLAVFNYDTYLKYAAIVGGIASVFGLLALALPSITTSDLKALELGSLKKVVDLAEEMKIADVELSKRSKEIDELKIKKKQMELLVRKASMGLYLQDQYQNNINSMIELHRKNKDIKNRLDALGEEIEQSGDQAVLEEIMEIVKEKEASADLAYNANEMFWLKPNIFGVGVDINALVKRMVSVIKKS